MQSIGPPRDGGIFRHAPLTVTINEAVALIGIGRTKLYELIAEGRLETTTIGRRRLVKFTSLYCLLEAQPGPATEEACGRI